MVCSDLSNIQEQLLQAVAEQLMSSTWRFAAWSEKHCRDWSEHGRALGTYWLVQTYNSTACSQLSNSTYLYSCPNLFPLISSLFTQMILYTDPEVAQCLSAPLRFW
jgi:hypothetical protein